MNNHIQTLLGQAILDVDFIRFDSNGDPDIELNNELSKMYIPSCFAERFAELIIKECADIVNKGYNDRDYIDGSYLYNHFGIKEIN